MTRITQVGSRLLASGTLTKESVDGLRELLGILLTNGAQIDTVDLSSLVVVDEDGARLLAEFRAASGDVRFDAPNAQARALLAELGALS